MCPDRDLISAYVDGEVPSPWRERLEEHLGSCPDCAAVASGYQALGERLRADSPTGEEAALARGRARLDALLLTGESAPRRAVQGWRRLSIPLPLAAAAALLAILMGGAATLVALKPGRGANIQTVASGEIAPPAQEASSRPASMDELLRYLDARDGQVTLTINLPSGTTFGSAGKPVIMRASPAGGRSP